MEPETTPDSPQPSSFNDTRKTQKVLPLIWNGTLPRFTPMIEGGPGTLRAIIAFGLFSLLLLFIGIHLTDAGGIDSAGPFLILISVLFLMFLVFWIVVKELSRGRDVTFLIHEKGIEIQPSARQEAVDAGMKVITHVGFLLTWKGGQWSAWAPYTPWKDIRRVEIDEQTKEILVHGGAWTIRLVCNGDTFEEAVSLIRERMPKRSKVITAW